MKKKVNSQPDTIIEFLGSQIDHETLRNILDIVEYAHVLKDDIEERAEYIKYRIDQKKWSILASRSGWVLLRETVLGIRDSFVTYSHWRVQLSYMENGAE